MKIPQKAHERGVSTIAKSAWHESFILNITRRHLKEAAMKTILILENDPRILCIIFKILLEIRLDYAPIVLSTSEQVEKLINPNDMVFDLILLDRNCSLGRSFHILDIAKFGPDKVIGMSSVPQYNDDLLERGVTKITTKDYDNLNQFTSDLKKAISMFFT
ncbi:MAG: hypothetical protein UX41_C0018G0024 [Candidatus Collierbacteria bacterium GW2011_GWE1_46_18]|uniref:Response regulatory domain-containing protein n=3 Tax=Candidatus Collieribacteriota TaxID=1752725 RepID=A0A0G1P9Y7_9BACT|nr:MAG: hypothetical protein UX41_C0018G0024 [Candidatus Collierbacteria bacterium GW2011_GWE1_46_18]